MKTNRMFKLKKYSIALLLTCFALGLNAQHKEGNNWIFGHNAGMTWNTTQTIGGLSGLPTPLAGNIQISQWEGSFCMSDVDGNLMFYSDGIRVWNKNHTVMPNGSGLTGNNDAAQSGIVVPYPGQPNLFIAFTIGNNYSNNLAYSVIDMTLDGGLGDIVVGQKNIPLTGHNSVLGENIATVKKTSNTGFWLVAVGKDTPSSINVWEITNAGVQTVCLASYNLPQNILEWSSESYLRFSPDGTRFAYPTYFDGKIFFGEFNPATGVVTAIKVMTPYQCYGLDFSASGELLYTMEFNKRRVHCYNFADLLASANPGAMPHYTIDIVSSTTGITYPLQLGPDGRLYSTFSDSPNMIVIDDVENYGFATATDVFGLLPPDATCGLGLPNIPSYFYAPVENTCSYFTDDIWYFGGGGGGIAFNDNGSGNKTAVSASGESLVNTSENSLSVSSPGCGSSLIFYAQHNLLYNALHQPMLDGNFSGNTSTADGLAACYIGDNQYMLFSVTDAYDAGAMGLEYHIIDMNEDGGYGKRIFTGVIESSGMSESIELAPVPGTSNEYWLIYNMYTSNEIRVRKITGDSVSIVPNYTLPMTISNPMSFVFKANKLYNTLALAYPYAQQLVIFDFDTSTGMIALNRPPVTTPFYSVYGIEFSPNGKYIFCANWSGTNQISQYDIDNDIFTATFAYGGSIGGGVKLGPDGKMYVKRGGQYMGVIDDPNVVLTSGGYDQNGFDLGVGVNSSGMNFSTGLTPPAICPTGLNVAPVAVNDTVFLALNGSTLNVHVLWNDYDPNPGDSISLINVFYQDDADFAKVGFSFFLGDSLISITSKDAAVDGDEVTLIYTIRDDANPIRLCADATLTIKLIQYHDNIIDETGCMVTFEEIAFSIKRKWYSGNYTANSLTGAIVGDLDGDGIPEIITVGGEYYSATMDTLYVLDGSTGATKYSFWIPSAAATGGWCPASSGLLVDSDGNGMGELILAGHDGYLTSYEADTTGGIFNMIQRWRVPFQTPTGTNDKRPQPIVADFNGDGVPEIVVFNQILNAVNGAYLGETEPIATAFVGRITNRNITGNNISNFMTALDFDNDGLPEIVAGGKIYKVNIDPTGTSATCSILYQATSFGDGFTAVADLDLDGHLDVVVVDFDDTLIPARSRINIWYPVTGVEQQITIPNSLTWQGFPFIGDIDGVVEADGKRYPEICVTVNLSSTVGRVNAYKYNPTTGLFEDKWQLVNSDGSGGTGITLFDFNNDGVNELLYRDMDTLYILNGVVDGVPPSVLAKFRCKSLTAFEYPVIADLDGSGSAQICVTCQQIEIAGVTETLNVFESATTPWAPTRKVWNQVNYEPTGINNDLTVPTKLFPKHYRFNLGADSYWPYNGALVQVPIVDADLNPVVRAADPYIVNILTSFLDDVTMRISVVIGNQGLMNANPTLPVSLYIGNISLVNLYETKLLGVALAPGNTVTLDFDIPFDHSTYIIYVRIQDDGDFYPAPGSYNDCNYPNNIQGFPFMKKSAYLNLSPIIDNGKYGNPVSVLYTDVITYELKAVNADSLATTFSIVDTVPLYLNYKAGSGGESVTYTSSYPPREIIKWNSIPVSAGSTYTVSFDATPAEGVSISQPLFINKAWMTSNFVSLPTNETYHQGAGAGYVTFLTSLGGSIYHADMQAVDYRMTPSSGIVIVPDEGYRFIGWSHDGYTSLRGEKIPAQHSIMRYDTLTIYGNVSLRANFEPEENSIQKDGETVNEQIAPEGDRVWVVESELFISTSKPNGIVRIYSIDGILQKQQILLQAGETKIQLLGGVYVVTLNNGIGWKIIVK